jgi:hypothetical protein
LSATHLSLRKDAARINTEKGLFREKLNEIIANIPSTTKGTTCVEVVTSTQGTEIVIAP